MSDESDSSSGIHRLRCIKSAGRFLRLPCWGDGKRPHEVNLVPWKNGEFWPGMPLFHTSNLKTSLQTIGSIAESPATRVACSMNYTMVTVLCVPAVNELMFSEKCHIYFLKLHFI